MEARIVTRVSSDPNRDPRRDRVLDFLEDFKLDGYSIGIDELIAGGRDLSQRSLARHIAEGVNRGTADESGRIRIPPLETDDGWRIELTAIRDTSPWSGAAGTVIYEAWGRTWSGQSYPLRTALGKKSGRYGDQLSMPLVIALNSHDAMLPDREFAETLFGEGPCPAAKVGITRGFWGTAQSPSNRRVSAVLFTTNLWPRTILMGQIQPCLYINPWPKYRYEGVLARLDTIRLEDGALRRHPGTPIGELLKLPPGGSERT